MGSIDDLWYASIGLIDHTIEYNSKDTEKVDWKSIYIGRIIEEKYYMLNEEI